MTKRVHALLLAMIVSISTVQLQAKNEALLRGGAAVTTIGVVTLLANLMVKDAAKDAIRAADKTPDIADDLVARGVYWYTHWVKVSAVANVATGVTLMALGSK